MAMLAACNLNPERHQAMNHEAAAQLDAIDDLARNAHRYRDTPEKIRLHTGKLRQLLGIPRESTETPPPPPPPQELKPPTTMHLGDPEE